MPSGKCIRCRRESETIRCLECPVCNQVSSVLSFIYSKWNPGDIEKLAERLRSGTTASVEAEAREQAAGMVVRLCQLIYRLSYVANCQTDQFKLRVADELIKQASHEVQVRQWETANNAPGDYNRKAGGAIAEAFKTHNGFSSSQAAQAVEPPPLPLPPEPAGMTIL